jgi:hypothetical protein
MGKTYHQQHCENQGAACCAGYAAWLVLHDNRKDLDIFSPFLPTGYVFWIAATEEGEVYTCNTQVSTFVDARNLTCA